MTTNVAPPPPERERAPDPPGLGMLGCIAMVLVGLFLMWLLGFLLLSCVGASPG